MQEQPFQVLTLLIRHPGQLLTREELQKQLWLRNTLVDPELGLNTAVKKIRTALGDSADNPRFVETLPRRGYRFIAPVQEIERNVVSISQSVAQSQPRGTRDEAGTPVPAGREPCSDFLKHEVTLPANRHKKYSYYVVPMLILVVAACVSVVVRQLEMKDVRASTRPTEGKQGVTARAYREVYSSSRPAIGIGGYDLKSPNDRAFAFDYDHTGKLDYLVLYRPGQGNIWILKNSDGNFTPMYEGNGIGGYNLKSANDRGFAFDYEHSGKLDHLVLYRPGTRILWILKNNGDGIFTSVYAHSQDDPAGIGGYDVKFPADQAFAFDYEHSGKLDHLVLYRSDTGTMWIVKNAGGTLARVYSQKVPGGRIGTRSAGSPANQAFALDYDHSGKLDHLVLYQPGAGTISILKNAAGTFTPVYEGNGIGGYDLKSPNDRALAFDYDHTGKFDHLLLYRPGTGITRILKNSDGIFTPVYDGHGIGGYDLKSSNDQALAFDYDHSGKLDHLVLYRPGTGDIAICSPDGPK